MISCMEGAEIPENFFEIHNCSNLYINIFFLMSSGTASYFQLTLIRGKSPQVDANTPFSIQDTGSFFVIKTPSGITLTWDKGTRVYLKLDTQHRGKVRSPVLKTTHPLTPDPHPPKI